MERKPQGFFTLAYVPPCRDLWLVATGTGLGPFLAMLRGAEIWQRFERVSVVHGARSAAHLSYAEELARARRQAHGPAFLHPARERGLDAATPCPAASPPRSPTAASKRAPGFTLDPERSHLMLCGNPDMILEVTAVLALRGLRKHRVRNPGHITAEKYW